MCGTPVYVFNFEDITAEINKRIETSESEKRYKSIINNVSEYIFSSEFDENGKSISCYHSPQCIEITGYSPEDFYSNDKLWFQMIYPDDIAQVQESIKQLINTKKGSCLEHRIIDKFGNIRWIANTSNVVCDENGTIRRIDGFLLDITQRKELMDNYKKYLTAVENSPASVIITDSSGVIEYVNRKFEKLTGYSKNEAIGKKPNILKSGKMQNEQYENLWKIISSGSEWQGIFNNKKKSGELYWEHASISGIKNENGIITDYIAVKEDITEIIETTRALEILRPD